MKSHVTSRVHGWNHHKQRKCAPRLSVCVAVVASFLTLGNMMSNILGAYAAPLIIVTAQGDSPAVMASGPLRVSRENGRYFIDGSGKAVYLTGSHYWMNLQDGVLADPPPHLTIQAIWISWWRTTITSFGCGSWEQAKWVVEWQRSRTTLRHCPIRGEGQGWRWMASRSST